ncbi:MAG TPA: dihydrolipoamide acetyltransferase family protein [Streptosporangiaceae bacterium]|nr:dihydrolipoamide acetyltransferase family protein [Streptosporangiaceae bacterium]
MSELRQFRLPDVGEGLTEADIVKWHVKPGDRVAVNQIIVEIETAKAVVELPSPFEGVVAGLLVPEGTTADVGTPIISVDVSPGTDGTGADQGAAAAAGTAAADLVPSPPAEGAVEPGIYGSLAPKPERQAVLVGYGVKLGTTARRARKAPARAQPQDTERATTTTDINGTTGAGRPDRGERPAVLAKPPVRKLARDLGVDLSALAGTGPNGSISRDDVLSAAGVSGDDAAAAAAVVPGPARFAPVAAVSREERIPIRGVRKHTAAAVTASAFTAPHVTEFLQIDMTETMSATARLKSLPDFAGVRVSPLLFVAKAVLVAVGRQPMINSSWDEAAQEIVVRHYVNLGIAAATDRGLIVPNIKDAQALTLPALARALNDLAETARAGKASPADLRGGTITITNVGVFGVDTGTPILSPGEAAILAFGQVKDAPWVHAGQLAVRKVTTLALSFDHRIIDGDVGSAVLSDIGAMLEDPLNMLAWA